MRQESAASAYKQAKFDSAPPLKIVHMMYEGALRFLSQARGIDPKAEALEFDKILQKATAVIFELRVSLDHEVAPELCRDLTALYLFTEDRIRMSLLDRTAEPLDAAVSTLETLLEGWKGVEVQESRG